MTELIEGWNERKAEQPALFEFQEAIGIRGRGWGNIFPGLFVCPNLLKLVL